MAPSLGHPGLALSTSIVALFSFVALLWTMRIRIGGLHGHSLLASGLKVIAASLVMGAVCYSSSHALHGSLGLMVSIPLGLAVFYGVARALRVTELDLVLPHKFQLHAPRH
jgi:peptidoglycan biosynthesis protein MviN/MurJ (putative lipid II flippase)